MTPFWAEAPNPDSAPTIRGLAAGRAWRRPASSAAASAFGSWEDLPTYDGAGLRIGIVSARWNSIVCAGASEWQPAIGRPSLYDLHVARSQKQFRVQDNLVAGAVEAMKSCNVQDSFLTDVTVSPMISSLSFLRMAHEAFFDVKRCHHVRSQTLPSSMWPGPDAARLACSIRQYEDVL